MKKVSRCLFMLLAILVLGLIPAHFGIGQVPDGPGPLIKIETPQAFLCLAEALENLKGPVLDAHFDAHHAITRLAFRTMIVAPGGATLYKGQVRIEGAIGSPAFGVANSTIAACNTASFYYVHAGAGIVDVPPDTFVHSCTDGNATGRRPLIGSARELDFIIHVGEELASNNAALDGFVDWIDLDTTAIHSITTRIGRDGKIGLQLIGLEQDRLQPDQIVTWWIEAPDLGDAFGDLEVTP